MVLVDTSVWVDHLRDGNPKLEQMLLDGDVICHPFVIGELACGNIKHRKEVLYLMESLPACRIATQNEFLRFVETHNLMGKGVGFVDVHLLVSAKASDYLLWTADKALQTVASLLNLS
ncbi:MAG: PIN domain-containing protein [Gammaproteobacteria bacterium]|nr:PIN domain-containing protein [Gammaproteobacteria bacterium]